MLQTKWLSFLHHSKKQKVYFLKTVTSRSSSVMDAGMTKSRGEVPNYNEGVKSSPASSLLSSLLSLGPQSTETQAESLR